MFRHYAQDPRPAALMAEQAPRVWAWVTRLWNSGREDWRETPLEDFADPAWDRSEEHTSELQSLMRISYAVFCLKKKRKHINQTSLSSDDLTHRVSTYETIPHHYKPN